MVSCDYKPITRRFNVQFRTGCNSSVVTPQSMSERTISSTRVNFSIPLAQLTVGYRLKLPITLRRWGLWLVGIGSRVVASESLGANRHHRTLVEHNRPLVRAALARLPREVVKHGCISVVKKPSLEFRSVKHDCLMCNIGGG